MTKVILLTEDTALGSELAESLPIGFRLVRDVTDPRGSLVFFDLDTLKPRRIRELRERNLVIGITTQKKTDLVMEATTYGAYEVIHRPVRKDRIASLLLEVQDFTREMQDTLPVASLPPTPTCAIVGQSQTIMDVCKKLARLSQVDAPVLITGETGTGKELIAESIAQLSARFGKPFVVVNCAAVPENLLESELFGFERGSFTGALFAKEGMLKIADEGCVFLDEIGELPLSIQAKLLRFLQTQAFYPIGSTKEVQVNVRVISATNRDLSAMVREGRFREDLYHRIRVTSIHIPPLRERKKDVLPLVQFFLHRYKHTAPRPVRGLTKEFLKKLTAYEWPGNIRELENTIRSAIALSKSDVLTTHDLRELVTKPSVPRENAAEHLSAAVVPYLKDALERNEKNIFGHIHDEVDRALLSYVLAYTRENQSRAAELLGINRLTLRKKIRLLR